MMLANFKCKALVKKLLIAKPAVHLLAQGINQDIGP